jgi:pheromone shutdown protein TraB
MLFHFNNSKKNTSQISSDKFSKPGAGVENILIDERIKYMARLKMQLEDLGLLL